ncbi:MAG: diacylglycerol/lipid kinase family protein [Cytophagaceae bacterium]
MLLVNLMIINLKMRVVLLHNPKAGEKEYSKKELINKFTSLGADVVYQSTKEKDYEKALDPEYDLVVIIGGDGTINKIARKLINNNTPIGIIPAGTANNIAKSLNIEGNPEEIIALYKNDKIQWFDVGLVQSSFGKLYFLESFGFGLFAHLMFIVSNLEKRLMPEFENTEEQLKFFIELMKRLLKTYDAPYYQITADGTDLSGHYLLVEVLNLPSIGPNLIMSPSADPEDGYLDLVLIKEEDRHNFMTFLDHCLTHSCLDFLPVKKVKQVKVTCNQCEFHNDDQFKFKEPSDHQHELFIELNPHALKILVS